MTALSRHHLAAALALGAAALVAAPAVAQQGTLTLNATVANACSVNSPTMNFGTYYSGQSNDLPGQVDLEYTGCPAGTTIKLTGGENGNLNQRLLFSGQNSQSLTYSLFSDSSRQIAWSNDGVVVPEEGDGILTVYAHIDRGQTKTAGNYADSVTIEMVF